jgi:hypothetical protein
MIEEDEQLQQRLQQQTEDAGRSGQPLNVRAVLGNVLDADPSVNLVLVDDGLSAALLQLADPWDAWLGRLQTYAEAHGDALVPTRFTTADGYALGMWVSTQRTAYKRGKLSEARAARLAAVAGWVWDELDAKWEAGYGELLAYVEAHGDAQMPRRFTTADGYALGGWVNTQRTAYKRGKLSEARAARLAAVAGWVWVAR